MTVDPQTFRRLAGAFATGVCVVTTLDELHRPKGLTTQSFVGLSTQPPLISIAVDKTSRTLEALRDSGRFVVNVLRAGTDEVSNLFASKDEEKFMGVPWEPSAIVDGVPILTEHALVSIECETTTVVEAGDHWIFIAAVLGGRIFDGNPLLYYRRSYAAWPAGPAMPPGRDQVTG